MLVWLIWIIYENSAMRSNIENCGCDTLKCIIVNRIIDCWIVIELNREASEDAHLYQA